ncbi:hypothetical protein [Pseudomonas sp. NPDC088444]|uniref:hypothetical protein n=1 Tax=Pseudomonas sp. NPDC088444 TaxID=3364456 RepID=UPI00384F8F89
MFDLSGVTFLTTLWEILWRLASLFGTKAAPTSIVPNPNLVVDDEPVGAGLLANAFALASALHTPIVQTPPDYRRMKSRSKSGATATITLP